jgi:hypothetical protein
VKVATTKDHSNSPKGATEAGRDSGFFISCPLSSRIVKRTWSTFCRPNREPVYKKAGCTNIRNQESLNVCKAFLMFESCCSIASTIRFILNPRFSIFNLQLAPASAGSFLSTKPTCNIQLSWSLLTLLLNRSIFAHLRARWPLSHRAAALDPCLHSCCRAHLNDPLAGSP